MVKDKKSDEKPVEPVYGYDYEEAEEPCRKARKLKMIKVLRMRGLRKGEFYLRERKGDRKTE